MRANVNQAYALQAMEVIENAVASAFLIALHNEYGFGEQRLNHIRNKAAETFQWYVNEHGTPAEWRGKVGKWRNTDGDIVNRMMYDLKKLGIKTFDVTDGINDESPIRS